MKGQLSDLILPVFFLFFFSVVAIIAVFVYTQVEPSFTAANPYAGQVISNGNIFFKGLDIIGGFVIIALYIGVLTSAFYLDTDARLFIVSMVLMIASILFTVVIANAWSIFVGVAAFSSIVNTNFTVIKGIFQNAPLLIAFNVVIWSFGFYAKRRLA